MCIFGTFKLHITGTVVPALGDPRRERPPAVYGHCRVRQIVCPVIPGTPKSVVGPLDILPRCSVGTLDLAMVTSANITAITALPQTRYRVMFRAGSNYVIVIVTVIDYAKMM